MNLWLLEELILIPGRIYKRLVLIVLSRKWRVQKPVRKGSRSTSGPPATRYTTFQ